MVNNLFDSQFTVCVYLNSIRPDMFCKNSQENTCAGISHLIKLQTEDLTINFSKSIT